MSAPSIPPVQPSLPPDYVNPVQPSHEYKRGFFGVRCPKCGYLHSVHSGGVCPEEAALWL